MNPPHPHPKVPHCTALNSDERRRNNLLFETRQRLLELWNDDPDGLRRRFARALENVRRTRSLDDSDVKVPIELSPFNTSAHLRTGYEDGEIRPEKPGTVVIFIPPTEGWGSKNKNTWSLHPVPTPPSLPGRPSDLQYLTLVNQL